MIIVLKKLDLKNWSSVIIIVYTVWLLPVNLNNNIITDYHHSLYLQLYTAELKSIPIRSYVFQ